MKISSILLFLGTTLVGTVTAADPACCDVLTSEDCPAGSSPPPGAGTKSLNGVEYQSCCQGTAMVITGTGSSWCEGSNGASKTTASNEGMVATSSSETSDTSFLDGWGESSNGASETTAPNEDMATTSSSETFETSSQTLSGTSTSSQTSYGTSTSSQTSSETSSSTTMMNTFYYASVLVAAVVGAAASL